MRNLEGVNCRLALATLLMQADIARRDDFRRAKASLASFALTRIYGVPAATPVSNHLVGGLCWTECGSIEPTQLT